MAQDTDEELLARFYRNDEVPALETFISRHMSYMTKQARYFVRQEDIEDIVQSSVIRLMDAKPNNAVVKNAVGWWHSMLASSAIDHLRAIERRQKRERLFFDSFDRESNDVESDAIQTQLLTQIRSQTTQLDSKLSDPLVMRYFMGMSYQEIAATMGLNVSTVSTRIARGLHALRKTFLGDSKVETATNLTLGVDEMSERSHKRQLSNLGVLSNWDDRWFVYLYHDENLCGIGHWSASENAERNVTRFEEKSWVSEEPCKSGYPESEEFALLFQTSIDFIDVKTLDWNAYRFNLIPNANYRKKGVDAQSISAQKPRDAISVQDGHVTHVLNVKENVLVLPQALSPLFICTQDHSKEKEFTVDIFGFDLIDSKRVWSTSTYNWSYVGEKGSPTGLHPTFEFRYPNRVFSVWTDELGRFAGSSDDRESVLAFESETSAREFLQSRA
ncbi:MAG: RNA polymerase sigma factor [Gammaproteobacteria bacterium]|nr:RNA polymerase sigma factor [Gammaproteobacteria bacterium]